METILWSLEAPFFSVLETKYLIETILMCQKHVSKHAIYSLKYEAKLSCMKIKWTAIGNKKILHMEANR
jgi:hypothetical protein